MEKRAMGKKRVPSVPPHTQTAHPDDDGGGGGCVCVCEFNKYYMCVYYMVRAI